MKNNTWQQNIQTNFNAAAKIYDSNADIQKFVARKLANICYKNHISQGIWADLGSGTGLLADSLEICRPNQAVIRLDYCQEMINQHSSLKKALIWDLNLGLPKWPEPPQLLASSFVLHWLINPTQRLKEWFRCLASGGWIALSLPIQGSFKEWYKASDKAQVPCTAIELPSKESILEAITTANIRHSELITFKQTAPSITSLFKTMVNVGAHTTQDRKLNIGEWRRLKRAWADSQPNEISLTWLIQLLLIQK